MANAIAITPLFQTEVQELVLKKNSGFAIVELQPTQDETKLEVTVVTTIAKKFTLTVPASSDAVVLANAITVAHKQLCFKHRFTKLALIDYGQQFVEDLNVLFDGEQAVIQISRNGLQSVHIHDGIDSTRTNVMYCIDRVKVIHEILGTVTVVQS